MEINRNKEDEEEEKQNCTCQNLEKFGTRQNMFIILILSNLWIHCDLTALSLSPSFLLHNLVNLDFYAIS
jgi:hypothetical protein